MTTITPNLGLKTYNTLIDSGSSMYDWIDQTSGSSASQNLGIIDAFAGKTSASMTEISASMVVLYAKVNTTKSAVIQVVTSDTSVDTTTGLFYFRCPSELNGLNIYRVQGFLNTAGLTGDYTIQVRNMTKYSSNDALIIPLTIPSGISVGTPGTINSSYDNVSTDDQLKIYVTGEPITKGQGLQIVIEFAYP